MENDFKEIIDRIRNRRLELGLSYQDLADKTGMSKSTLQRYETGFIKNIPLSKVEALAKALRVTPEYLMGWEEKAESPVMDDETLQMMSEAFSRPEMRALFSVSRNATREDIEKSIKIIEMFKGSGGDE
jgi:transcriptional regulator with XRE-family HTH domain